MGLHLSQRPQIPLQINRPLNDEIFSSLRYLSEIEEVGHDFIRSNGFENKSKTHLIFQEKLTSSMNKFVSWQESGDTKLYHNN